MGRDSEEDRENVETIAYVPFKNIVTKNGDAHILPLLVILLFLPMSFPFFYHRSRQLELFI